MMRGIAKGTLLSTVLILASPAAAQSVREHEMGVRAFAFHETANRKIKSFEASADALEIVGTIMGKIGLPMNLDVRSAPDVPNAQALVEQVSGKEVRVILYNPTWMDDLKETLSSNWVSISIMAHEIGHHLAGHMDPAYADHPAELEADKFSGFILNKMGASLEQSQLAMAMTAPDQASPSHPGRSQRVVEIARGWNEAAGGQGANVIKSAPQPVPDRAATVVPGQRVALLIGNSRYKSVPLRNPKNDVIAIQRVLRKLGFSTITLYDGSKEQIAEAVRSFHTDAKDADWALFYFAGSGLEFDGVNYMVPIEADYSRLGSFMQDYPELSLKTTFEAVGQAKSVRLVVVDACRLDPNNLPDASGQTTGVFKVVEPPPGVVVAYSTRAGQAASDGPGDLSPYAQAMIESLSEPGIELDKVFRRVNARVLEATGGKQAPSVIGDWPEQDLRLSSK
jgi:hypothetical protein